MNANGTQTKVQSLPLVSIIIVNYNGKKFLESCLTSLALVNSIDFEVLVVDNASTDGSYEEACTRFPDFSYLQLHDNLGYSAAVNAGIKKAKGEYILTLNNDIILDRNFITYIRSAMDTDATVGMCASKMIFPDKRINSTGIYISRSWAAWDRGVFQLDRGQFDQPGEVFGPNGGAGLYRRKMLEEIGYFDEDFFLFYEDLDVAFRGRLAGWRCLYNPLAVAIHHHGGTTGPNSDLSIYYAERNILWYIFKDLPVFILLIFLPLIFYRNVGVIAYVPRDKRIIVLKAKLDGYKRIGLMMKKRRRIIRKVSYKEILKFIDWSSM